MAKSSHPLIRHLDPDSTLEAYQVFPIKLLYAEGGLKHDNFAFFNSCGIAIGPEGVKRGIFPWGAGGNVQNISDVLFSRQSTQNCQLVSYADTCMVSVLGMLFSRKHRT